VPDLKCGGGISQFNVKPGSPISGSFTVTNIGQPYSELDWEIDPNSYPPDWGSDWSFEPSSGSNLAKGESVTVAVSFCAPNKNYESFSAVIRVINTENPSDYDEIPIVITTPVSKIFLNTIFPNLFQKFPVLGELSYNFLLKIK
jgi:hypothetical protein